MASVVSARSPDTSANATPMGSSTPIDTVVVGPSSDRVAHQVWEHRREEMLDQRARRRARTITQRTAGATDTEDDADVEMGDAPARTVGIVAGDDDSMQFDAGNINLLVANNDLAMNDLAMGAPPGAPGAAENGAGAEIYEDENEDGSATVVQATPRQTVAALPPTTPRASTSSSRADDGPYREEDVLIALQLLAYLSKYPHVRQAFYKKRPAPSVAPHPEPPVAGPIAYRDARPLPATEPGPSTLHIPNAAPLYPRPSMTHSPNVFSLVERFTFRPSTTEAHLPSPPALLPAEIQYWAGVIMRNACRKDEARGGIRQCANMLCGRWEESPRQFAKCRRCRKAKYCGKECQSRAWSEGHRFWCSSKEDENAAGVAVAGPEGGVIAPQTSPVALADGADRPTRPMPQLARGLGPAPAAGARRRVSPPSPTAPGGPGPDDMLLD